MGGAERARSPNAPTRRGPWPALRSGAGRQRLALPGRPRAVLRAAPFRPRLAPMARGVAVIANPLAGKGRGRRAMAEVAAALSRAGLRVEVMPTRQPGHAAKLAAAAVGQGYELLLAVGGDGTLHEVAGGVLACGAQAEEVVLAPIPAGTCNSFCRDFGLAWPNLEESVRRVLEGRRRRIDAARVIHGPPGGEQTSYFVNVFGVGFMAQVAEAANRRFKFLGGQSYTAAVFWRLAALGATLTRLELFDGTTSVVREAPFTLVGICNSQWTGEGMWIAPPADPSDGKLDVLTLGPISRLGLARLFPRIFSGEHLKDPRVSHSRATRVSIVPATPGPLLADGEVFGTTPVSVEVLPGALAMAV